MCKIHGTYRMHRLPLVIISAVLMLIASVTFSMTHVYAGEVNELQNISVDSEGVMTWDPDPEAKCYQVFYGDGNGHSLNMDHFFAECSVSLKAWLDSEVTIGNITPKPAHTVQIIAFNQDFISEGKTGFITVESIPADVICARGQVSYSYKELDNCKNVKIDKDGVMTWSFDGFANLGRITIDNEQTYTVKPLSGDKDPSFSVDLKSLIDEAAATGKGFAQDQQHEIKIELYERVNSEDEYEDFLYAIWTGTYDYLSPYAGKNLGTIKNVKVNSDQQISWDAYKNAASYDITVSRSNSDYSHTYSTNKNKKNKIKLSWGMFGAWSSKNINRKTINLNIVITARNEDGITIAKSEAISHKYKKNNISTLRIKSNLSNTPEKGKKIQNPTFNDKSGVFGFKSCTGCWYKKSGNKWVQQSNSGKFTTGEWKYIGNLEAYYSFGWAYNVLADDAKLYVGGVKCKHGAIIACETDGPDYDQYLSMKFESPVFRIGSSPKTTIKKVYRRNRGFKLRWKKKAKVAGYQVRYSTTQNFTDYVYTRNYKKKARSATIGHLKRTKRYYVQVRTYRLKNGKKYYSPWSAKKSVKTK